VVVGPVPGSPGEIRLDVVVFENPAMAPENDAAQQLQLVWRHSRDLGALDQVAGEIEFLPRGAELRCAKAPNTAPEND